MGSRPHGHGRTSNQFPKQAESVAKYHAEFTRLRQHIKWNEDALKNAFYGGLKDHIKDWLSTQDRPTSLKDLIDKTLRYDARKYERFQEKKLSVQPASTTNTTFRSSQPAIYNTPTPSSSNSRPAQTVPRQEPPPTGIRGIPTQTSDGTVPMELGVKHLSAAERERRRINHLCYYCGESNHNAVSWTAKPKRIPFFQFSSKTHIPLLSRQTTSPGMSQGPFLGVHDKAPLCQVMLHFIHHGQVTSVPASIPCSTLPQYSPLAFVTVRIRQASSLRWVTTIALIDCGAQGNFISPSFVEKHFLNQVPKSSPLPVQWLMVLSRGGLVTHHDLSHLILTVTENLSPSISLQLPTTSS